eukprot:jgi/Botrbrau1/15688/Bobra.4_1s0066.1
MRFAIILHPFLFIYLRTTGARHLASSVDGTHGGRSLKSSIPQEPASPMDDSPPPPPPDAYISPSAGGNINKRAGDTDAYLVVTKSPFSYGLTPIYGLKPPTPSPPAEETSPPGQGVPAVPPVHAVPGVPPVPPPSSNFIVDLWKGIFTGIARWNQLEAAAVSGFLGFWSNIVSRLAGVTCTTSPNAGFWDMGDCSFRNGNFFSLG